MCACTSSENSWKYIRTHHTAFLWSDDEDPVGTWNRIAARDPALGLAQQVCGSDGRLDYQYGGQSLRVPLRFSRDDGLVAIHTLALLVRADSEIRFCCDSAGSSDKAFLPLAQQDWANLESAVGRDLTAQRFLALGGTFDEFLTRAFPHPGASPGTLMPSETDWEGGPTYRPGDLQYVVAADGPGLPRQSILTELLNRHIESATVCMALRGSTARETFNRADVLQKILPHIGRRQIRLMNTSLTGFVVIESNGTAAGWRTHSISASRPRRPWWRVWE
jgi:hypothetical protein